MPQHERPFEPCHAVLFTPRPELAPLRLAHTCVMTYIQPLSNHSLRLLFAALWVAASFVWTNANAQNSPKSIVTTDQVRAELMAHAPQGVSPGQTVMLGLQMAHQPEWHTYWKNAGDSGLPTQLTWQLPAGLDAGEIQWPLPKKIPIGDLANYGYEGTVLLPVPVTVSPDFKPPLFGEVEIKLKAAWLVCKKECIPQDGEFVLKLPVKSTTAMYSGAFDAAAAAYPKPLAANPATQMKLDGDQLKFTVHGLPAALHGKPLNFFPEIAEVIHTPAPGTQAWQGTVWTASVPVAAQRSASPAAMALVLAAVDSQAVPGAFRADLALNGSWPAVAAQAGVSPELQAALNNNARPPAPATPLGFWAALIGAVIGGLILNLMPCVFPVLAIKVLGFAQHGGNVRAHRVNGVAYTVGVVLSFMALGGVMLALRAAGEQLGWGFQLQAPAVVATLAALFTLIGLNLAGVFEFGNFLPSSVATLQAKHPAADSFLSGVLAVAIASPCTAPFMGASLGLAVGLPPAQALAIFAAIGIGMALPYLAASWIPAVARALPRPGAWMDTFRRFMAFPMFATVVWLVWVLGQQTGIDGAGALLALLVLLSMVVWALSLSGRTRLVFATISIAALALSISAIGTNVLKTDESAVATAPSVWQNWEPGKVEQLLASGQPVFVDFTAAWCVTCQYNKRTTLANADVLTDLAGKQVALLRADWTRRDPAITAALSQLGRSGVPVYVFYKNGAAPVVLSEVIGVEEVRSAIAKL
jgi:thiol:disulfide interchange protein